jgi:hypothetical protein
MSTEDVIMKINKPHFIVKLHSNLLEVDLKEGLRKELEDVLEAKPILRDNLGYLFQTAIPLDVPLKDIESAIVDKKGKTKITLPHRKDIIIPLKAVESKKLVAKLNELIPIEKAKELEKILQSEKTKAEYASKKGWAESVAERERKIPR